MNRRPPPPASPEERRELIAQQFDALAKRIGPDPYEFAMDALEAAADCLYMALPDRLRELRAYMDALAAVTTSTTRDPREHDLQQCSLAHTRARLLRILEPRRARYRAGFSLSVVPESE